MVYRLATDWMVRGSNPGGDEIFRSRRDRPWAPPSLLHNAYRVFPGGKAAGLGVDHPLTYSAGVKERVELCLYSPSGSSRPLLGRTFILTLPLALREGETFSHQFVWLLGAYRLPNSSELNIYLEESTLCNCRKSCNTFSETFIQQSYDTLIQTYEGRDLQICIVLVAVK